MDKNYTDTRLSYLSWLCELVGYRDKERIDAGGYIFLLKALYEKEFYWTVEMDANRAEEGKALRDEFADGVVPDAINGPCSVLEMMIGLARRWDSEVSSDLDSGKSESYFWIMIKNLGLEGCVDESFDPEFVDRKLDILLERGYSKDGKGGLFPLKTGKDDLRKVEIWYQLQRYLMENYDF